MKECTKCFEVKEDNEFSPQKTASWKVYSWCDECRKNNRDYKPLRIPVSEAKILRAKAVELRKFDPDQCVVIKAEYESGARVKDLAVKYNTSKNAVYRAIKGYSSKSLKAPLKSNPFM